MTEIEETTSPSEIVAVKRQPLTSVQDMPSTPSNESPKSVVKKRRRRRNKDGCVRRPIKVVNEADRRAFKPRPRKPKGESPRKASTRILAANKLRVADKPLVFPRTIEYVNDPCTNDSNNNKLLFAATLDLLPITADWADWQSEQDSGFSQETMTENYKDIIDRTNEGTEKEKVILKIPRYVTDQQIELIQKSINERNAPQVPERIGSKVAVKLLFDRTEDQEVCKPKVRTRRRKQEIQMEVEIANSQNETSLSTIDQTTDEESEILSWDLKTTEEKTETNRLKPIRISFKENGYEIKKNFEAATSIVFLTRAIQSEDGENVEKKVAPIRLKTTPIYLPFSNEMMDLDIQLEATPPHKRSRLTKVFSSKESVIKSVYQVARGLNCDDLGIENSAGTASETESRKPIKRVLRKELHDKNANNISSKAGNCGIVPQTQGDFNNSLSSPFSHLPLIPTFTFPSSSDNLSSSSNKVYKQRRLTLRPRKQTCVKNNKKVCDDDEKSPLQLV